MAPPRTATCTGAADCLGRAGATVRVVVAELLTPHHRALWPTSPHSKQRALFLQSAMRCLGEKHLKQQPLAFLKSSARKRSSRS